MPTEAFHVLDYLDMRVAEGAPRVEEKDKVSIKPLVVNSCKEVLLRASQGRRNRQAPRPFYKLLWSMERFILNEASPPFLRVFAWWKCLQSWVVLRFDDHHGFRLHQLVLDGRCLTSTLHGTKTTAEGKEVSLRPLLISRSSWVGERS